MQDLAVKSEAISDAERQGFDDAQEMQLSSHPPLEDNSPGTWTHAQVGIWLQGIGGAYDQYVDTFRTNGVDGAVLLQFVNEETISELVASKFHQQVILYHLKAVQDAESSYGTHLDLNAEGSQSRVGDPGKDVPQPREEQKQMEQQDDAMPQVPIDNNQESAAQHAAIPNLKFLAPQHGPIPNLQLPAPQPQPQKKPTSPRIPNPHMPSSSSSSASSSPSHSNLNQSCPVCCLVLANTASLKAHVSKHCVEKPHKCTKCTKAFKSPYYLKTHRQTHVRKPFFCKGCHKGFAQPNQLKDHYLRVHSKQVQRCSVSKQCPRLFSEKRQHISHENRPHKHYCHLDGCGGKFAFKTDLRTHLVVHSN